MECKNYRNYAGLGYCLETDIVCLIVKYGFENIKTHTVIGPYSNETIYLCDGKLEKKLIDKKEKNGM